MNSFAWYISGPMSGLPQFNAPVFKQAAKQLRDSGYTIVSPLEMDDAVLKEIIGRSADGSLNDLPNGTTWGSLLGRDVAVIADMCGGIIMLPGWEKSRGARLEVATALLTDKQFALYHLTGDIMPVTRNFVIERLRF